MRQLKTLLTTDERGSEIATSSVFHGHLSLVGRLRAINNSVSNYFWPTFVSNSDGFDCRLSGVNFVVLAATHYHTRAWQT